MSINSRININQDETELLVDENELEELGLEIREPKPKRGPPQPRYPYTPAQVDSLLAKAGYEPTDIPRPSRRTALFVAWAWARGLGDDEDVARATGRTVGSVRRAARALNLASKPSTIQPGEIK
jgi:hypothetical protein